MTTFFIILAVVAALVAFIASRPADFRLERATTVSAPPERVFPLINDFHSWNTWSPWEALDPSLRRSNSGAPAGVGAVYE